MQTECPYIGERYYDNTNKEKHYCNHPKKPLGMIVCKCDGCGPKCSGHPSQSQTTGVVIGCYSTNDYDMLGMIRLQIASIRKNNGAETPILLSVDQCEHIGQIESIADAYECDFQKVTCESVNPEDSIGHAGGDLGAFHNGLLWASAHGMKYLAKLSQRYLIDTPGWIKTSELQNYSTLTRTCLENAGAQKIFMPLRTEAVFMRVADWLPAVPHMKPRRVWPMSGEAAVWQAFCAAMVGGPDYLIKAWRFVAAKSRHYKLAGVLWKCANTREEYEATAKKYGIDLGEHFQTGGWPKGGPGHKSWG